MSLTRVTLRARLGHPLADERVAATVEATAHAIGERQGVRVTAVEVEPDSVSVTIIAPNGPEKDPAAGDRSGRLDIVALGFAAELRRVTEAWYRQKYDSGTLWGETPNNEGYRS